MPSQREIDAINRIAFATSVDKMGPFFGVPTSSDLAETIALQAIQGFTTQVPSDTIRPPAELGIITNLIINSQDGGLLTIDLIRKLGELYQGIPSSISLTNTVSATGESRNNSGDNIVARLARFFRIIYMNVGTTEQYPFYLPSLETMLRSAGNQRRVINSNPNSPSKQNPSLSALLINTTKILPATKNVGAVTLFMNSVPPLERSRAVPFVNIQFLFGREPVDGNNQVQTMSLLKFLEGAVNVGSTGVSRLLVDLNTVSGSISGGRSEDSGILSSAGMELFFAPQTLVSADEVFNSSTRAVPVIDKFRPFMTFKNLTIDIAPSIGLMSYKTAKMEFVLHDRSRMHEIADFIKPDLYGTTELYLEYGWQHPDSANANVDELNPYGILINGMRSKEKYGIRNVSFSFDDAGQVNVVLDLYMKGGNEFYTETISQFEDGTENVLKTIERLARDVASYERRLFGTSNGSSNANNGVPNQQSSRRRQGTREIRGVQILESANDWQGRLQLSSDMLQNLRDFRNSLRRQSNIPEVSRLIESLQQLYRDRTSSSRNGNDQGGALVQLTQTTQRSIESRIAGLSNTTDQFLPQNTAAINYQERRMQGRPPRPENSSNTVSGPRVSSLPINTSDIGVVSLGKLLLTFVGEPLALTGKYDDVQFIFYPFNQYAGFANTLNIAQFPVDVRFFIQQYTRYRTESLSRAANMPLKDFLDFLANIIIDDPAAPAYGLGSLYEEVINRQTGVTTTVPRGNAVQYQTAMEARLRTRTPDATFKMPQIDFYVECVPGKIVSETGNTTQTDPNVSILKIHVFDRQATPYDTQAGLLAATRDDVLNTIGSLPQQVQDGEEGIRESYRATVSSILNLAGNLIRPVQSNSEMTNGRSYRINGGQQEIKNFVMSTMPYMLYGIQGSGIIGAANLSSMQNPALSTVNMLRSFQAGPFRANGEQPGGLPLSIIPCELSLETYGCPLIDFSQQFFMDFGTGTTADNIYAVVGLSHKIEPGNFQSSVKFTPLDAYGKYTPLIDRLNIAAARLADNNNSTRSSS